MTDKYFAFYWCFCVRNSFILLLIKWSEMDVNVKPQTLVETFDQAKSNSQGWTLNFESTLHSGE